MVVYSLVDDIGVITINNPPVNALSQSLRAALLQTLSVASADASRAVLLICQGRTFIAGADITEFGAPPLSPSLREVVSTLDDFPKLLVVAMHGNALGGGLEIALACHYRCAAATAQLGFPEVKLGLLPGAGGTQRLPRLVGVQAALDMMTTGNPVSASQALVYGLIDEVLQGELYGAAIAYMQRLLSESAPLRRIGDISMDADVMESDFLEGYRSRLNQRARGQIAADRIVSCVEAALHLPMQAGLERERALFVECLQSPQSRAMRHIFFAEREAARIRGLSMQVQPHDIRSVAVVGSGTMGAGIAMCFVNVGMPVTLLEIDNDALQRGLEAISRMYEATVSRGRMTELEVQERLQRITATTDYADVAAADLVIEAVFEDPALKRDVFQRLDNVCKPTAILASNTSYQNIDDLASVTARPQQVLGMHFFSPANVMKLVEIVRGEQTADHVLATVMSTARKIGKVGVLSRVCYGFIGNRMLTGYLRQAHLLLLEGATPSQVDAAAEAFGMAMGPLAMSDLAGLDVGYKARAAREERGEWIDPRTHCIASALVELGRLGQKSGAGYYRYDPQTRARQPDPQVEAVIHEQAASLGVIRREHNDQEIVARLIYALVNEGARILAEGVAQRAGDIDVVYVHGYAFPQAKGGPMHYADEIGLGYIHETICRFAQELGMEYWQPAPLLEELALQGGRFSDWTPH